MDEPELGRLLSDAVPEPVAPPDRLARIARRVRRRRRIAVAATGAAVAVVAAAGAGVAALIGQGSPTGPAPAIPLAPDGCPPATATAPVDQPDADRAGRFVPEHPSEVVMCEKPAYDLPPWMPKPIVQRRLSDGDAAKFAALLNRGRTAKAKLADERRQAVREGSDPGKVGQGCAAMGQATVISFVLHYPDGTAVPVLADQCGGLYAGGRTRFYDGGASAPVEAFLRRYRDALAASTDPATIATPTCAAAITPQRLNRQQLPSGPVDGVAPNRRWRGDGLLPNAVVAVATCRYTVTPGGAHLIAARTSRAPGDLQQTINRQAAIISPAPGECGRDGPAPTTLDVITAADATGARLEVWLYRAPCAAFVAASAEGMTIDPGLRSYVDGMLGPPR